MFFEPELGLGEDLSGESFEIRAMSVNRARGAGFQIGSGKGLGHPEYGNSVSTTLVACAPRSRRRSGDCSRFVR